MLELLPLLVILGLLFGMGVPLLWLEYRSGRAPISQAEREVARRLGLEFGPAIGLQLARATGKVDSLTVHLEIVRAGRGRSKRTATRIAVEGLPTGLRLDREQLAGLRSRWSREDTRVGLADFDELFRLEGLPELELLSLLGHRSRQAMAAAIAGLGAQVADGRASWQQTSLSASADDLERVARALLELATALREHSGPPARGLLHHAFADPEIGFRRRALEALFTRLPRSFEATEALPRAERDPDPVIRFLAARHRGEAGLDTVRALLAEGLPDERIAEARALLAPRDGGGLSLSADPQQGELSLQRADEGGLSEPAPGPVRGREPQ